MIKIVAIVGPTATGKSSLGVRMARIFTGEIIACDSRQVYRHLEVGTGKATLSERRLVPHFLMDVIEPDEVFHAARYRDLAEREAGGIAGRGHVVFLVGGTGLYLRAFLGGLFPGGEARPEIRRQIAAEREKEGDEYLHRWLQRVDPESAARIHPHDVYRVTRALEICLASGAPAARMREKREFPDPRFRVLKLGILLPTEVLRRRIAERVEWMFETGREGQNLVSEVEGLRAKGYDLRARAFTTIGYREAVAFLWGELTRREAKEKTCRATWAYARRQLTWFKKENAIEWFDPERAEAELSSRVSRFLEN